jgi:hypothetical protein
MDIFLKKIEQRTEQIELGNKLGNEIRRGEKGRTHPDFVPLSQASPILITRSESPKRVVQSHHLLSE